MIKKLLIAFILFIAIGFGLLKLISNAISIEWGHHFSFENELGIEIDSLEITVGDKQNIIHARLDSLRTLEGNIEVPTKGYPHKVTLKIYNGNESTTLKADSFNCYNCDGSHEYIMKRSGAEYRFLN